MRERGDTLVEVLIATAILGAAVVAGLGAMNYGFGMILNAIERTQVQAALSSQLSLVQYARDEYLRAQRDPAGSPAAQVWADIMTNATTTHRPHVCRSTPEPDTSVAQNPFYISEGGDDLIGGMPAAASSTPVAGRGLWVEAVKSASGVPARSNYIDIYVKACWSPAVGSTAQEARSVMRLYAPQ